jgi:heme-degrading monooxygenase HmoA
MIARIWRGSTATADADAYVGYMLETGVSEYRKTPGNRGAWILRRTDGDRTDFVTLSFWESREAIRAFAGDDIERAVFYPEDDRFLIARELGVEHYEVIEAAGGERL